MRNGTETGNHRDVILLKIIRGSWSTKPVMPDGKKVSKELLLDPAARIKLLSEHGSSVEVKKAIPIKRYYRSGSEMERQVGLVLRYWYLEHIAHESGGLRALGKWCHLFRDK